MFSRMNQMCRSAAPRDDAGPRFHFLKRSCKRLRCPRYGKTPVALIPLRHMVAEKIREQSAIGQWHWAAYD